MNVGAQHSCFSLLQLHNGLCGPEHLCQLLALVKSRSLISTPDTLPSNEHPGHCPATRQNAHVILWKKIENFSCISRAKTGIFYTFEKTQGGKNLNFSAEGRKIKSQFFKSLLLLEISIPWKFFSKNLNILKQKKAILVYLIPKLEKKKTNHAKIAFSFQCLHKKLIFSGNSSNLEKLK